MRLSLYRFIWIILLPVYAVFYLWRCFKGKEQFARMGERLGKASVKRGTGDVLWFHAASVGESVSILDLLNKIAENHPDVQLLVTTGTKTSAKLMKQRLPKGAVHQYLPWDCYFFVKRFIRFWQPKASFFVDSEFWPELLQQAPNPVLLNGRISDKSFPKYKENKWFKKKIIGKFKTAYAQDDLMAERLTALGVETVKNYGNLKLDTSITKPSEQSILAFENIIQNRPVFVISNTHAPEEELLLAVYESLKNNVEDLFVIIAPRHPHRGASIAQFYASKGLNVVLRGEECTMPTKQTDIYVADTIGEMPLWYTLADAVFVGGSFIAHGGQNPYEALRLGKPTFCGPHMFNFKEMMRTFLARKVITTVQEPKDLVLPLTGVLTHKTQRHERQMFIQAQMQGLGGAVNKIYTDIEKYITGE